MTMEEFDKIIHTDSMERVLKKGITQEIENELDRIGMLYRIFTRVKDDHSIYNKLKKNPGKYKKNEKMIQDVCGVRLVLYFSDDIGICQTVFNNMFEYDKESSSVDNLGESNFSATRYNLVYRINPRMQAEFNAAVAGDIPIDCTFEVQLRTVLSEGWHEVDHDLRYKCREDWEGYDDLGRTLNGFLATLETSDWGMQRLFEELAYRQYKAKKWSPMLRSKFRLRLQGNLSESIENTISENNELAKSLQRINRKTFIESLARSQYTLPITMDNVVYAANRLFIKNKEIESQTPEIFNDIFPE